MGAFTIEPNEARNELIFRPEGERQPTDDDNALMQEFDRTVTALRDIYADRPALFQQRFDALLPLAKSGLEGPRDQPVLARRLLEDLRADVVRREAGAQKQAHLMTLGRACLRAGVPPLVAGALTLLFPSVWGSEKTGAAVGNFLLVLAACAAGVWVSFGARKSTYTFEDLVQPERDYLSPGLRLGFAFILTAVLTLLFHAGGAAVKLGTFGTDQVLRSAAVATVVGFMCGFSEQVLAKSVQQQAAKMLGL